MHQQYGTNVQCWPHGQHRTTVSSPHDRPVDISANAGTSRLADLHTSSTVLSILLTISSPPPLKCYHHATAAAMIPRFHKVYAEHKHRKASGPHVTDSYAEVASQQQVLHQQSKSHPCHVPSASLPLLMGIVSDGPISELFTCAGISS